MSNIRISESRVHQGYTVIAFTIIGTGIVALEALEPGTSRTHSTISTLDGESMGWVCSRSLPEAINDLPFGDERIEQVGAFHRTLDEMAADIIRAAYPELVPALRFTGAHGTCSAVAFAELTAAGAVA